jgi:hypothetical protein
VGDPANTCSMPEKSIHVSVITDPIRADCPFVKVAGRVSLFFKQYSGAVFLLFLPAVTGLDENQFFY